MAEQRQVSLDLSVGEVGAVPLERQGTAGYDWQVTQIPPGIADVAIEPRAGGAAAVGAATLETLRLRPTAPGEHDLVLTLRRPWESAPVQVLHVMVRAR
ncbi:protease inhibitor I42 family protein [Paracraurococcus lichenis]|uniref:Protease inhibitor I42 family protein n=1 Tax=Paracraurococcus lichenis TaxID=3064888 RepID=A0ABT9DXP3_9PROT|nr:protease inhibitor I42 family protein [Paracraurococcus sp. LOR1-02]MDO9708672.1 protease inhibitor I42 family protein [Paracraurococcus sp. LOR1-02]